MIRRTAGSEIDADAPLMEAGLDSLGAVELRNQLSQATEGAAQMPDTLIFDHPTARGLEQYLQGLSGPPVAGGGVRAAAVAGSMKQVVVPALSATLSRRFSGSWSRKS